MRPLDMGPASFVWFYSWGNTTFPGDAAASPGARTGPIISRMRWKPTMWTGLSYPDFTGESAHPERLAAVAVR